MFAVTFHTGVGLDVTATHRFWRPIQLTSMATKTSILNLHELITFLTNLQDVFEVQKVSETKCDSYQEKATPFCHSCETSMFTVFANLTEMSFSVKVRSYCPHQPWAVKEAGRRMMKFISNPSPSERPEWPLTHPFRVICKRLMRSPIFPASLRQHYRSIYCKAARWKHENEAFLSFEHFVHSIPGWVDVYVSDIQSAEPFIYDGCNVVSFVWIPPWSRDILARSRYIQLDASFKAVKPYVYCVPLGIHANESFPLAVVVGISESRELYELFYATMARVGVPIEELNAKPILSDQHSALRSIGETRVHFWCLRHLIEKFGSSSFLGEVTRRLAFSSTPDEFRREVKLCGFDLRFLLGQGRVTEVQVNPLFEMFGLTWGNGELDVRTDCEWEKQALWIRASYGVASCSNHIEGFHRSINEAVSPYWLLMKRLSVLISCVRLRYQNACQYSHAQGLKLLKKLGREQEALHIQPVPKCYRSTFGWGFPYSSIWGVSWFPCVHEFGTAEVDWCPHLPCLQYSEEGHVEKLKYNGTWDVSWRGIKRKKSFICDGTEMDEWDI
jgi:hypothetical protein